MPIVLLILFVAGMSIIMMGVPDSFGGRSFDDERFFSAKNEIETLSAKRVQTNGHDDDLLKPGATRWFLTIRLYLCKK
jgi:hypothetical protein